ncbi:MAG: YicC family protein [Deltaproteobacteria bacterium]|jgi:uncharacterized protein (TIGR00255 family)|nr:YicC family protein [Deltaproteobacteria bacterium]
MIKSMTGFGAAAGEVQGYNCRLEIKTLNNRFKEFVVRSPHVLFQLEEPIKKLISNFVHRGRVELWVQMEAGQAASGLVVNLQAAREVHSLLTKLNHELELEDKVTLDQVLKFNVITASKGSGEFDAEESNLIRDGMLELARRALEQLMAMREVEGRVLAEDLLGRLTTLCQWLEDLKKLAVNAPLAAAKRYQARLEELAETLIDPARLAQEAAISAEKMDITEEMTRFGSHIQSFHNILVQGAEPVGRRLEFLLQEMVREANTMGAKSQSKSISDMVLNFKSELEKIREQVLNIE